MTSCNRLGRSWPLLRKHPARPLEAAHQAFVSIRRLGPWKQPTWPSKAAGQAFGSSNRLGLKGGSQSTSRSGSRLSPYREQPRMPEFFQIDDVVAAMFIRGFWDTRGSSTRHWVKALFNEFPKCDHFLNKNYKIYNT
jgi:hypothetical protein